MESPNLLQFVFGTLTLVTGLMVIFSRNPVVSAIMLMGTLFFTGGLYFGMGLYFIGAVQILIYAGAISVLFVFIVMLLDLRPAVLKIPGRKIVGGVAAVAGLAMLAAFFLAVV